MIPKVGFTYTGGSEAVVPAVQGESIDAFSAAKARFENTISELTKEKDELKGRVNSLKAQLEETGNGQAEAMAAAFQMAVAEMRAELLGVIAAQKAEMAEFKSAMAPLQAKYQAELEAERIAKEQYLRERKEAAIQYFINCSGIANFTKQIEHIQSMNLEEIEHVLQEKMRWGQGRGSLVLARMIGGEQWTKERLLQPWR